MDKYRGEAVVLYITMQEQDRDALADIARSRGVTVSWLAAQAVRELIENTDHSQDEGAASFAAS